MTTRLRDAIRRGGTFGRRPGAGSAWTLGLAVLLSCASASAGTQAVAAPAPIAKVDFKDASASAAVRGVAAWISSSRDNHGLPYAIVDKVDARVFVFDARGHLLGADAALLGMARGDRSVQGVGDREMSAIRPEDRTTPAGRFRASLDRDSHGKEILVVDYAASISLHAVVRGTPAEQRARRLASPTPADNRISFGCINVPVRFYRKIVSPAFTHTFGIVYVLPETSPAAAFFGFMNEQASAE